jgi:hypothetical protein
LCAKNQADYHLGLVQKRFVFFPPLQELHHLFNGIRFSEINKISVGKWLRFTSSSHLSNNCSSYRLLGVVRGILEALESS